MKKPMEIDEIVEAVEMLEQFDKSLPSTEKIEYFRDGIQLLNEYLNDYPESPHKTFVTNKKIAHTRRLLEFLNTIDSSEFYKWFSVVIVLFEAEKEIESLSDNYPELKIDYEKFVAEWKDTPELIRIINKLIKK